MKNPFFIILFLVSSKEETIEDGNSSQPRIQKSAKPGNKSLIIMVGTGSGKPRLRNDLGAGSEWQPCIYLHPISGIQHRYI